jgi:phosphatidylinositol 4-kinase
METEPAIDTYAWETMSESLVSGWLWERVQCLTNLQKLASICCLAQKEIDETLYNQILLLLSMNSPVSDNLVQEAALKSITILVRRFVASNSDFLFLLRVSSVSPTLLLAWLVFCDVSLCPPCLYLSTGFHQKVVRLLHLQLRRSVLHFVSR